MISTLEMLAINESKLDYSFDWEISICGYTIVREDRNRYGGGIALYVRENLSFTIRNDLVPSDWRLSVLKLISLITDRQVQLLIYLQNIVALLNNVTVKIRS